MCVLCLNRRSQCWRAGLGGETQASSLKAKEVEMARCVETVYLNSPVWAQQLMVGVYGFWWYRRRFGPDFYRFVADFKTRDSWTATEFAAYQQEQLMKLIAAAWRTPYYRQHFQELGIRPGGSPFDVLYRLPFLSKEVLRTRARDLVVEGPLPKRTLVFKSSGTTGTPAEIYYSRPFHSLQQAAFQARNVHWAGIGHRDRRVMFGVRKVCAFAQARPPFWRFSPAENMAYASIYHLSPRFLPYYLSFLRSYRPENVMGYPSALYTIARHALDHNDLPPPARAVFTTSETLSPRARAAIEGAWQCRVREAYGAVEGCVLASQCDHGRYHVSPEIGLVEILDATDKPAAPGVMGEVVCTGLQNTLQPLIRYRIGDVARWAVDQNCACGRQMPILEAIDGRVEDICYTTDGRQMLRFDTVFKGLKQIKEAQVVQEKLDSFTIYVVPTAGFGAEDVKVIQQNMRLHVGNIGIHVKKVDSIRRSASGKFRAVVCNLSVEDKRRFARARSRVAKRGGVESRQENGDL